MATNLVVEDPGVEVVAEVDMTKVDMITVVDMTRMVQVMMMEVVMIVIMMVAAMVEVVIVEVEVAMVVGIAIVGMAMMDMVEEGVTLVVVGEEVAQEARTPVEVKVGQAGVDQVAVVAAVAALVVVVGVHVVVHLEEEVGKVEEGALVHRSGNMVATAIKGVAVATLNPRGSMLITVTSMASRSHSSSGAKTTATVTKVISSGTKTAGRSSSGSDYADWQPFNLSNQISDELIQFFCLEPNHFLISDWIGKLGQTLRKCT